MKTTKKQIKNAIEVNAPLQVSGLLITFSVVSAVITVAKAIGQSWEWIGLITHFHTYQRTVCLAVTIVMLKNILPNTKSLCGC